LPLGFSKDFGTTNAYCISWWIINERTDSGDVCHIILSSAMSHEKGTLAKNTSLLLCADLKPIKLKLPMSGKLIVSYHHCYNSTSYSHQLLQTLQTQTYSGLLHLYIIPHHKLVFQKTNCNWYKIGRNYWTIVKGVK